MIDGISPLDESAMEAARALHARLTKPAGSLGALEELSVRLAGLAGECPPPLPEPAAVAIFAGDHGVHAQGVTPWPQEVTGQMVANFLSGGAVVNAFARQIGASVTVVDVGVLDDLGWPAGAGPGVGGIRSVEWSDETGWRRLPGAFSERSERDQHGDRPAGELSGEDGASQPSPVPRASADEQRPGLVAAKVRAGTRDMTVQAALTRDEVSAALEAGARVAFKLVDEGARALVTGDMGIANTTPAATLIAAFTGADAAAVTGRGTGIDDDRYARKVAVVRTALEVHKPDPADPVGVLAAVGGLEHAAIAGFILGGASRRVPVILDGVIAVSAALAAAALAPDAVGAMVAGHRSAEPGATVALAHLGLEPLIDLGLRLGEGTGAVLAVPIVASAVRVLHEVATFDSAGVSEK
jgi:nicotinate-nucleotide--dimethylbenzimidazole phosphoribosyltransferase